MSNERKVRFLELRTLRPKRYDEKIIVEKDGDSLNGLYAYNPASRMWHRTAVKAVDGTWQSPEVAAQIAKQQAETPKEDVIVEPQRPGTLVEVVPPEPVVKPHEPENIVSAVVMQVGDTVTLKANTSDAAEKQTPARTVRQEETVPEQPVEEPPVVEVRHEVIIDEPEAETVTPLQEEVLPTVLPVEAEKSPADEEPIIDSQPQPEVKAEEPAEAAVSEVKPFEPQTETVKPEEATAEKVEPEAPKTEKPVEKQSNQMTVQQKIAAARMQFTKSAFAK